MLKQPIKHKKRTPIKPIYRINIHKNNPTTMTDRHTHTHIHARTHARTHAHTHTYTHTHTQTLINTSWVIHTETNTCTSAQMGAKKMSVKFLKLNNDGDNIILKATTDLKTTKNQQWKQSQQISFVMMLTNDYDCIKIMMMTLTSYWLKLNRSERVHNLFAKWHPAGRRAVQLVGGQQRVTIRFNNRESQSDSTTESHNQIQQQRVTIRFNNRESQSDSTTESHNQIHL